MAQFMTLVELAREYDLSIPDVQDCARNLGLPWKKGVTMLNASQVAELRPALDAEQRTKRWQRSRRVEPDVVHVECACCQLTLDSRTDLGAALCDACRHHFAVPGENVERKLARLSDHDERMRKGYVVARENFYDVRRQLAIALQGRDDWREAATKLVRDHVAGPRGHCEKCNKPFPCEPVQILRSVNYGFVRYTERFAGYSDEEVERLANPRRTAEREYWRDETEESG
jgi:hypothetical protein